MARSTNSLGVTQYYNERDGKDDAGVLTRISAHGRTYEYEVKLEAGKTLTVDGVLPENAYLAAYSLDGTLDITAGGAAVALNNGSVVKVGTGGEVVVTVAPAADTVLILQVVDLDLQAPKGA